MYTIKFINKNKKIDAELNLLKIKNDNSFSEDVSLSG